jgi:hypothetical protein
MMSPTAATTVGLVSVHPFFFDFFFYQAAMRAPTHRATSRTSSGALQPGGRLQLCACARWTRVLGRTVPSLARASLTSCILETRLLLFVQTAMRFSMNHALIALVIAAVFIPENRGAGIHSQWLDVLPDFAFNSPIDEDIAILNASMSHSFRFIDLNTTDTELLFSIESNRQA